ncbi:MAG TPA: hypothetical protein PLJ77_06180 [Dokdonella sp.]|uniref:hypothetical protein n=1 Tax=Dokdonella sp. TaxID=2291710 RepID=UPI002CA92B57|nr:hypothetical protein [Dokdonella sp.]HQX66390.1 hypothetical protein [Dokdonella sp.]HQY55447.1 hypothetical protein [Dokdonella sp.]HQZ62746.1 hypothetical protein [Dokdonella sp.]
MFYTLAFSIFMFLTWVVVYSAMRREIARFKGFPLDQQYSFRSKLRLSLWVCNASSLASVGLLLAHTALASDSKPLIIADLGAACIQLYAAQFLWSLPAAMLLVEYVASRHWKSLKVYFVGTFVVALAALLIFNSHENDLGKPIVGVLGQLSLGLVPGACFASLDKIQVAIGAPAYQLPPMLQEFSIRLLLLLPLIYAALWIWRNMFRVAGRRNRA